MKALTAIVFLFVYLKSCGVKSQNVPSDMYTKEDILQDLETLPPYKTFFSLKHPYVHTAGSRITLFADEKRWAIVFEKAGYGEGSTLELNYFGNCLVNQSKEGLNGQYLSNTAYFSLVNNKELASIEAGTDEKSFGLVARSARQIKVRNISLPIEQDIRRYIEKGIRVQNFDNPGKLIDFPSLIRYLDEENPGLFRATDAELRTLLPTDLPKLFVIDKWHHKEYYVFNDGVNKPFGDKPGSYETYPMIADVLVSKDTTKWKPALKPNNDWRNWPRAGSM